MPTHIHATHTCPRTHSMMREHNDAHIQIHSHPKASAHTGRHTHSLPVALTGISSRATTPRHHRSSYSHTTQVFTSSLFSATRTRIRFPIPNRACKATASAVWRIVTHCDLQDCHTLAGGKWQVAPEWRSASTGFVIRLWGC